MDAAQLAFPALTSALKAAGEATRLRILALLAEAELTVSDLTDILRQSQPRLSRHLRLLAEAGLVERFREGSWAFYRLGERGGAADIAHALIARLDPADAVIARDRERLAAVRAGAQPRPRRPISAVTPPNGTASASCTSPTPRSRTRSARRSPTDRSARCSISAPAPGACWNCSAPSIERGLGLDMSLDMLSLARARLDRAGLRHCSVRQGDIYDLALAKDSFDVVIIHQVLHFLDDCPRAIARGGARAAAGRPAAGRRFCAARSRIPARGARASPARLRARDGGAMDRRRRPRPRHSSRRCRRGRTARSRCRCGWRATRASRSPVAAAREVA